MQVVFFLFLMLKNATDFSQVLGPIQSEKRKRKRKARVKGRTKRQTKTQKSKDFENKDADLQGSIYSILPAVKTS